MKILFSKNFAKSFQKLPKVVQKTALKKEIIFRQNPFDARLKTHQLQGSLKKIWSFSINYSYRITFTYQDANTVVFLDIGTHSICK